MKWSGHCFVTQRTLAPFGGVEGAAGAILSSRAVYGETSWNIVLINFPILLTARQNWLRFSNDSYFSNFSPSAPKIWYFRTLETPMILKHSGNNCSNHPGKKMCFFPALSVLTSKNSDSNRANPVLSHHNQPKTECATTHPAFMSNQKTTTHIMFLMNNEKLSCGACLSMKQNGSREKPLVKTCN